MISQKSIEDRRGRGVAFLLMGVLALTMIDVCAKWLVADSIPSMQVAFVRFLVPTLLMMALFLPRHGLSLMHSRAPRLEIIRALCLLATTILNFFALRYLPLTITGAIMFTSPLIVCLLSGLVLKEKLAWQQWLAMVAGFIAVLIIIQPDSASLHPAMLLSATQAVFVAIYAILTRRLAGVDSSITQQCYIVLVGLVAVTPFAFQEWVWPESPMSWAAMFGVGLASLVGHSLFTIAHRYAPVSTLAPFTYIQLAFMAMASWLFFGQRPDLYFYIGLPILIGSGLYVWYHGYRHAVRGA